MSTHVLSVSPTLQDVWSAWTAPLIAQAKALDAMARAHSPVQGQEHILDQPGVRIVCPSAGQDGYYYFDFQMPGFEHLGVACRQDGVCLVTEILFDDRPVFLHLSLEKTWDQLHEQLQDKVDMFSHAHELLTRALEALTHGTPLMENATWEDMLLKRLEMDQQQDWRTDKTDWMKWEHWTRQYGTPEMVASLNTINGLFDSNTQPEQCREALLWAWVAHRKQEPSMVLPSNFVEP